jgi:hypothetical protein
MIKIGWGRESEPSRCLHKRHQRPHAQSTAWGHVRYHCLQTRNEPSTEPNHVSIMNKSCSLLNCENVSSCCLSHPDWAKAHAWSLQSKLFHLHFTRKMHLLHPHLSYLYHLECYMLIFCVCGRDWIQGLAHVRQPMYQPHLLISCYQHWRFNAGYWWYMPILPAPGRLRKEDHEFKTSWTT